MNHMLAGSNLGLITTRSIEISKGWEHVLISKNLIQHHTVSNKEVNYLFPLYIYPIDDPKNFVAARKPNLNRDFVSTLAAAINFDFTPDRPGEHKTTFGPEDIFHYLYAVLHSPEYRRRYADFLKSDFPRIPLTSDPDLFIEITGLGQRLVALHLMEVEGNGAPIFPITGTNHVEKVCYTPCTSAVPGRVWINSEQYFEGVTSATWDFSIGGYRSAEKWLTDRKGLILSFDDISHYRRLSAALAETQRIMVCIDEAINAHGGWPLSQ